MLLVYTVQLCNHHLSIVTAGIFQHLCRRDHGILCPADLLDHTAGRELFSDTFTSERQFFISRRASSAS